jgi:hypothetical protein
VIPWKTAPYGFFQVFKELFFRTSMGKKGYMDEGQGEAPQGKIQACEIDIP